MTAARSPDWSHLETSRQVWATFLGIMDFAWAAEAGGIDETIWRPAVIAAVEALEERARELGDG